MKKWTLLKTLLPVAVMLFGTVNVCEADVIAGWSFPTTSGDAPATLAAECGENYTAATLYADGTYGSSNAAQAARQYFAGVAYGAGLCEIAATGAYGLVNNSQTGTLSIVFKISTSGFEDIQLQYDTRGSATGYDTHVWAYSTDGSGFTDIKTVTGRNATTFSTQTVDFSAITAINNYASVYIRLTVSGASSSTGNNRLDNVYFTGTALPMCDTPSTVTLIDRAVQIDELLQTVCTEALTLPEPTFDDCAIWTFAGWKAGSEQDETTVKPILIPSGEYIPDADVTLYAVYERTVIKEALNVSILPADFNGTSYAANNGSHTKGDVDYYTNQMMLQSGRIQMQSNTAYIYNTSALPQGTTVTIDVYQGVLTFYQGTSVSPSTNTSALTLGVNTFTLTGSNQYFRLVANGGTPQLNSITFTAPGSSTTYDSNPTCPPVLKSFKVKWTDAVITAPAGGDGTIVIDNLNSDRTDCMEVYFELDGDYYATGDYAVYLTGDNAVNVELGTELDKNGIVSKYVCFNSVEEWTGTLVVKTKADGATVETYTVLINSDGVSTGLGNPAGKELQDTQCYSVTGLQIDCNRTKGLIIKRDGTGKAVKELK